MLLLVKKNGLFVLYFTAFESRLTTNTRSWSFMYRSFFLPICQRGKLYWLLYHLLFYYYS